MDDIIFISLLRLVGREIEYFCRREKVRETMGNIDFGNYPSIFMPEQAVVTMCPTVACVQYSNIRGHWKENPREKTAVLVGGDHSFQQLCNSSGVGKEASV